MALESLAGLITPLVASALLKFCGESGYTILAGLDVLSAGALIALTLQLREVQIYQKFLSRKDSLHQNVTTAKIAIKNVVSNSSLKMLLLYRSLANHVSFLFIISLPICTQRGMPDWIAGILTTLGVLAMMIANKYTYKIGEKRSYNAARVVSTVLQAILLILVGLFIENWIVIAGLLIAFNLFEGIRQPARNHVLVEQTQGKAIATTRSIVFSIFALYTVLGKQFLSFFDPQYALIGLGIFIILVNVVI